MIAAQIQNLLDAKEVGSQTEVAGTLHGDVGAKPGDPQCRKLRVVGLQLLNQLAVRIDDANHFLDRRRRWKGNRCWLDLLPVP